MRRKLCTAAAAVISGILFTDCLHQNPRAAVIAAAVCVCLVALLFQMAGSDRHIRSLILLLLFCFLTGCILISLADFTALRSPLVRGEGEESELYAVVEEVEPQKDSCRFRVRAGRDLLLVTYRKPIRAPYRLIGMTVRIRAVLERPRGASNPRTFDYSRYLLSEGIRHTAEIRKLETVPAGISLKHRLKRLVLEQREKMIRAMDLREDTSAIVEGVLFGETARLSEETSEEFRRNGTAHVLAVSGLHVGILYSLYRRFAKGRLHLYLTMLFGLFLLLYGTAALWSVSVTRAVILVFLASGADLFQRRYDLPTALAFAALLSVLKNPYVIFGAGFQMSFLAVLSLCMLIPAAERLTGRRISPAVTVQLGLMPYIAYTFNYISVAGFLCNIPVVYLISLLVPAGVLLYFVFLFTGILLPAVPALLGGLADLIVTVNDYIAAVSFLSADVTSPPLWMVWALYFCVFLLSSEYFYTVVVRREKYGAVLCAMILASVVFLTSCVGASPFDCADVVFLDVGQGDSIHLKGKNGQNILVDGGGSLHRNVGKETLKPYLLKNGVSTLSLAAATHLHTDHYLGLVQLAEVFPVKKTVTEGKAGQRIRFGKDRYIDIIWPEMLHPDTDDENLNSLIFKVWTGGITVLLTGDLTEEGETMLLAKYAGTDVLSADVLKIGHHGSAYSTSDRFLAAVNPSVAVISVGKNNYGHPSNLVIEKLENLGIMVYRTDRDGAVGIIKKRGKISVCTENP